MLYRYIIKQMDNETHQDTTGFTPIEMHFNKKSTLICENYIKIESIDDMAYDKNLM